jgi:hypothetical protein
MLRNSTRRGTARGGGTGPASNGGRDVYKVVDAATMSVAQAQFGLHPAFPSSCVCTRSDSGRNLVVVGECGGARGHWRNAVARAGTG